MFGILKLAKKFKLGKTPFGGPGTLITAAFIGPGTVTVCTLAGSTHGLQLLWAVVLSIIVTILFQEMASRLGIITQLDLTSLIKRELKNPLVKSITLIIVLASIVIGNGAYEAGNISGGALGLDLFVTTQLGSVKPTPLIIGLVAFMILWFGHRKVLERSLTFLVLLMSMAFIITAIMTKPDLGELFKGMFIPAIPENGLVLVLGVIGTTVVPYNLFLHTSLAKSKWNRAEDIPTARKDTIMSIIIGGLVSLAIVISASSMQGLAIHNAIDLGKGMQLVFGISAKYLISIGLFAAGITSAITAPLAASYVMCGAFNWHTNPSSWKFRSIWMSILGIGVLFSLLGFKPIDVIRFAQVANGLLLPIIGILLIWLCSKINILGIYKNRPIITILSSLFILLIVALGIKNIWSVFTQ